MKTKIEKVTNELPQALRQGAKIEYDGYGKHILNFENGFFQHYMFGLGTSRITNDNKYFIKHLKELKENGNKLYIKGESMKTTKIINMYSINEENEILAVHSIRLDVTPDVTCNGNIIFRMVGNFTHKDDFGTFFKLEENEIVHGDYFLKQDKNKLIIKKLFDFVYEMNELDDVDMFELDVKKELTSILGKEPSWDFGNSILDIDSFDINRHIRNELYESKVSTAQRIKEMFKEIEDDTAYVEINEYGNLEPADFDYIKQDVGDYIGAEIDILREGK